MDTNTDKARALFSARLSSLIQKKGIRQNELARAVNVSESSVGKWLLQKSMPRMGTIQRIADYFCVGKSYLLEEKSNLHSERWALLHLIEALPEDKLPEAINYLTYLSQTASRAAKGA